MWSGELAPSPSSDDLVRRVRDISGVSAGVGPDDESVAAGIRAFAGSFEYWYVRVIREVVPRYRENIVARINPFVRRIELDGLSAADAAQVLAGDYTSRQFVTAGGWAIEALATSASPTAQKSATEGIDLQRYVKATNDYHLYVVKSGTVTRNSDILSALKRNARQAEKILRQDRGMGTVVANYVVAAGKTSSTFADGIRRPASAEFWAEILGLPEDDAVDLALAIAQVAGDLIQSDAEYHEGALVTLLTAYIEDPQTLGRVDWEFLAERTMRQRTVWKARDAARHARAEKALEDVGYDPSAATAIEEAVGTDGAQ